MRKYISIIIIVVSLWMIPSCKKESKCIEDNNKSIEFDLFMMSNELSNLTNERKLRIHVNDSHYCLGDSVSSSVYGQDFDVQNGSVYVLATVIQNGTEDSSAVIYKDGLALHYLPYSYNFYPKCIKVVQSDVYVGGDAKASNGNIYIRLWKNGSISNVTDTQNRKSYIGDIEVDGTDVYICGSEINTTNNKFTSRLWKNGVSTYLGDDGRGAKIKKVNGKFIIGGYTGELPCYWNDLNISVLGNTPGFCLGANFLGEDIVASGAISNNSKYEAVVWRNGVQTKLTSLDEFPDGSIAFDPVVFNSDLYIGGCVYTNATTTQPVYWKNGQLNKVYVSPGSSGIVSHLYIHQK